MTGRGRLWLIICGEGFASLVAIEFIRPAIPHPTVTTDLVAPPHIKQILKTSCYDCHSNETRLAWFDQIVPAYWLVRQDVLSARERLSGVNMPRAECFQRISASNPVTALGLAIWTSGW